jgi:hypothetical protein
MRPNGPRPGSPTQRVALAVALSLCVFADVCPGKEKVTDNAVKSTSLALPPPGGIAISRNLPNDIPGGALTATLSLASSFAWNEFFALNWPATAQSGQVGTRGVADPTRPFGDPSYSGPLVWETYRSKVEIFPGNGAPPGYTPNAASAYGFDAAPAYNYLQSVPPCSGQAPAAAPPFVNLDEVTQIGLDTMFAGIVPQAPTPVNSDPQRIRFLAKANRTQYAYVAANGFWNHGGNFYADVNLFTNALKANQVPPPPTNPGDPVVISFPSGTVEVKAGWRMLAPAEDPKRFHTATVRYYENAGTGGTSPTPCYRDAVWGLVALHIIQKTPSAPTFIYATFEQADNIRSGVDGKPVEDANGNVINPPPPNRQPTTPFPIYHDGYDPVTHQPNPRVGVDRPFCSEHGNQIFYKNLSPGLPKGSSPADGICINSRYFAIPPDVIAANVKAHQALAAAGVSGPWQYYKLVNVQWRPFNAAQIDPSAGPNAPNNHATFSMANIVVETNSTLQAFQGALIANGPDAGVETSFNNAGGTFNNVHIVGPGQYQAFNMGGCMGCHGNAQVAGTDFSFILNFGGVNFPEYPETALDARRGTTHYFKGFPSP